MELSKIQRPKVLVVALIYEFLVNIDYNSIGIPCGQSRREPVAVPIQFIYRFLSLIRLLETTSTA